MVSLRIAPQAQAQAKPSTAAPICLIVASSSSVSPLQHLSVAPTQSSARPTCYGWPIAISRASMIDDRKALTDG